MPSYNVLTSTYKAPQVNPLTYKALSIPIFNPINRYGRVFFFSWLGFFVAFLSWFAFPPLVSYPFLFEVILRN